MVVEYLSKFFLFLLAPRSLQQEKRVLAGMTAGIGIIGGEGTATLLVGEIAVLRNALAKRTISCIDITETQAKWLRIPLDSDEKRPSYNLYGTEKFPKAQFYVVFSIEGDEREKVYFSVYGASFTPLTEAEIRLQDLGAYQNLMGYLRDAFGANLAQVKNLFPKAFQPGLSYGPPRREISKVFTLPDLR